MTGRAGLAARVALLGFGVAGRVFHAPLIAATVGLELAAIVTSSPDRTRWARHAYPSAIVFDNPEAVWSHASQFDAVVVAGPNAMHAPLAHRALEAGLAVVVDKPLAVTADDARGLIAASESSGVPLTVFLNRRWDGDFLTVRRLIAEGRVGEVRQFESRFTWWQPTPGPGWKSSATTAEGGGTLYDMGPHLIDQAIQLFGPVRSVSAQLDRIDPASIADDHAFVRLEHESGVRSRLWMSPQVPLAAPRFWVLGTDAGYIQSGLDPQQGQLAEGVGPADRSYGTSPRSRWGRLGTDANSELVPTDRGAYQEFYAAFSRALAGEGELPVDPAEAVVTLELIETLHRSPEGVDVLV